MWRPDASSGTATAPSLAAPRNAAHHARPSGTTTATRSPPRTPASRRRPAARADAPPSSSKVHVPELVDHRRVTAVPGPPVTLHEQVDQVRPLAVPCGGSPLGPCSRVAGEERTGECVGRLERHAGRQGKHGVRRPRVRVLGEPVANLRLAVPTIPVVRSHRSRPPGVVSSASASRASHPRASCSVGMRTRTCRGSRRSADGPPPAAPPPRRRDAPPARRGAGTPTTTPSARSPASRSSLGLCAASQIGGPGRCTAAGWFGIGPSGAVASPASCQGPRRVRPCVLRVSRTDTRRRRAPAGPTRSPGPRRAVPPR